MHYAYNEEVLEANEILVRIPLSDSSPQVHKPYIDDMSDADTVYKMENAINMVMNLEEPACAMNLKKALVLINKKR
jgi:hypothetical protein